jgi:hypothetical protein
MKTIQHQHTKVITPSELNMLRYPLSESWKKAAGLLKNRKKALARHLETVRKEWGRHST